MKNTISQAFIQFQAQVKPIHKTKTVSHGKFSYDYATLEDIVTAIQPTLHANGLAFRQKSLITPDTVSIQTILVHTSGEEWDCGTVSMPLDARNPQEHGKVITYCRRYSLTCGLGLVVSDSCEGDNDANKDDVEITSNKKEYSEQEVKQTSKQNKPERIEMKRFFAIAKKKHLSDKQMKAIVYLYTQKISRADVTHDEFNQINRDLEDATRVDIVRMIHQAVVLKNEVV